MLYPRASTRWQTAAIEAGKTGKPLTCFRRGVLGALGLSMHYGAAYFWARGVRWPTAEMDARSADGYVRAHQRFAEYTLAALALPSKAEAQALIDAEGLPVTYRGANISDGSGRGVVLIIQRKGGRVLQGMPRIVAALQGVSGGRAVVVADWTDMGARGAAALLLSADLVVSAHGAGNANLIYARPGTVWIELVPPGAMQDAAMYLAIAQRLGVRWLTLPLIESDPERARFAGPKYHRRVGENGGSCVVGLMGAWTTASPPSPSPLTLVAPTGGTT